MKKILIILLALLSTGSVVNAQIVRAEELEKYAKKQYGEKWVEAAAHLGGQLSLDKNKAITFVQIIEAPGKTKAQLYTLLNYWFTSTFNDSEKAIKLNDKELGTIIANGYVADIAQHIGGADRYNVSIRPVIKCDIKDGKVRMTYTLANYDVVRTIGGGWMSVLDDAKTPPPPRSDEKWTVDSCFPFAYKDSHKKTSSKALVMAHAYSNVIIDKIEECVKNGLVGNENDDW